MDSRTHEVFNQFDELCGYNLFTSDAALCEAVRAAGAEWAVPRLEAYGREVGSAESFEQADEANKYLPEFEAFDSRGRRVDRVKFHPSWHAHLARIRAGGWIALPFVETREGRWAADLAGWYLQAQVESGSTCPSVMTWAAIPVLEREPALWQRLQHKLLSAEYDARDLPIPQKRSIYIGMGMTEKQGGSDVRANMTRAVAVGEPGRGRDYLIRGHKWFFSAPMCDAHLVVAQVGDSGPGCFFVPRWQADGSRNAVQIQRLKPKVGNKSNASSEVEFHDAVGTLIGEEGRGIPTIIEMAGYTRLACVTSSSGFIRQALVQAIAYTRQRMAFGKKLVEQPLMRNVLADIALESEAALALTMRLARAFEHADDPAQRVWKRVVTPAAKFWVCKRAVEISGEAIEIFGGNGYVETGPMARLYRETPVNSIWEGSGNVMCLDMLRAITREPEAFFALLDEAASDLSGDAASAAQLDTVRTMMSSAPHELEGSGRLLAQRLVLVLQAALLRRNAPPVVADAFIATRFGQTGWGRVAGAIDASGIDVQALLARAWPA